VGAILDRGDPGAHHPAHEPESLQDDGADGPATSGQWFRSWPRRHGKILQIVCCVLDPKLVFPALQIRIQPRLKFRIPIWILIWIQLAFQINFCLSCKKSIHFKRLNAYIIWFLNHWMLCKFKFGNRSFLRIRIQIQNLITYLAVFRIRKILKRIQILDPTNPSGVINFTEKN
jgi:hypothetical protein